MPREVALLSGVDRAITGRLLVPSLELTQVGYLSGSGLGAWSEERVPKEKNFCSAPCILPR